MTTFNFVILSLWDFSYLAVITLISGPILSCYELYSYEELALSVEITLEVQLCRNIVVLILGKWKEHINRSTEKCIHNYLANRCSIVNAHIAVWWLSAIVVY